ncbi:divergent polysaccharide deacetylase family protein [Myxococcota bacterium]|nr:divergent polysaccharide deacetylase family protein [Myxococcota bacterium]
MGPGPGRALSGRVLALGLALALGMAGLWAAPFLARMVVDGGARDGGGPAPADPAEVDAFLAAALPAAGLTLRHSQVGAEGLRTETWAVPPGRAAEEVAQGLRQAARAEGVELHLVPRDELDALVRVYAGSAPRRALLLVPTLPADTTPPAAPNRRERPLLGLVIGGLGEREAAALVATPLPLTVAVRPFLPHSLAVARDAARAWQEVLVDVAEPELDPAAARAAVPFAREVTELQARITHLLATRGRTAVLLEHDDPALPGLLGWAARVAGSRYRLVLAHELARPEDTVGLAGEEPPAALSPP